MTRISLPDEAEISRALPEIFQPGRERSAPVLNIARLVALCPGMGGQYLRFAGAVLRGENVPMRLRELATLRVAHLGGAEYAFQHHIPLGQAAGLTGPQIEAIRHWEDSPEFDDTERLVLAYTDAVARDGQVSDDTFAAMQAVFSDHDIVELTLVIAYFVMLGRILVAFQVDLEPGFTPWPSA